jgi:hypothetical protein
MSEVIYFADRVGKKPSPLPGSEKRAEEMAKEKGLRGCLRELGRTAPHVRTALARTRSLAERARSIVAARKLELPKPKHLAWVQGDRGILIHCILALRSDLSESSAFTCARDIEEGRSTFEEVANGRPVDADRLVALQEAWKVAEAAYKTALEEECKRSGQNRMSVGHAVEKARKKARKQSEAVS